MSTGIRRTITSYMPHTPTCSATNQLQIASASTTANLFVMGVFSRDTRSDGPNCSGSFSELGSGSVSQACSTIVDGTGLYSCPNPISEAQRVAVTC
eukprot:m.78187 g.78187  ORF g.78187 m.78187 type:complete len:96 (+) comp19176_c0_seq2:1319-1606(+)